MKLYIISNRLPVKVTGEAGAFVFSRSEGGLATGLDSLNTAYEKHWIGWPGICVEKKEEQAEIGSQLEKLNFHPVTMRDIATVRYGLYATIFTSTLYTETVFGKPTRK